MSYCIYMDYVAALSNAQQAAQCFVNKINEVILFPLITLLMALAFLWFLYGAFEYVKNSTSEQGRETGRQHLFYGTIGMLVMLSAWGILSLAAGTFNIPLVNTEQVACGVSPSIATAPGSGGGFGSGPSVSNTPYGGAFLPGGVTPELPPPVVVSPGALTLPPEALVVDTLPEADTSAPPCPPDNTRIDGLCTQIYPFTIRNGDQIEVSCIDSPTCIGAINACTTTYGGVYGSSGGDGYILCSNSNFSSGPPSTIVYANAPEGLFTTPPELAGLDIGVNDVPLVGNFEGGVNFSGTNIFISPEFEENYNTYIEPYVVKNNADEQAVLGAYPGATGVLFMAPMLDVQAGGTVSQLEQRCKDLNGGEDNLVLESGSSKVTTVSTYVCLRS